MWFYIILSVLFITRIFVFVTSFGKTKALVLLLLLGASAAASEFCEWVQVGIDIYPSS